VEGGILTPLADLRVGRLARGTGRLAVWILPLALPLVPAIGAVVTAQPGEGDVGEIAWALWAIPLCALLGSSARAVQLAFDGVSRGLGALLGLAMGLIGMILGYFVWFVAVTRTCDGRYECPF
jgi:hypothetical protein